MNENQMPVNLVLATSLETAELAVNEASKRSTKCVALGGFIDSQHRQSHSGILVRFQFKSTPSMKLSPAMTE